MNNIVLLGAGISSLSAAHHLKLKNIDSTIIEKNDHWGGLCAFFEKDGFRFDKFAHFSFAPQEYIKNKFESSSPMFSHIPNPSNYYQGAWIKHPAQNNLFPLPIEEKIKIIHDFIDRPIKSVTEIKNYSEWLHVQYGDYFAENFPTRYTKKYWCMNPEEMETKWVGQRMYTPDLDQVLRGAFAEQDECFYYTKHMNYPLKGGFRSILNSTRENLNIELNKQISKIENKTIYFQDGSTQSFDTLISSIPLPELISYLDNVPTNVTQAVHQLRWTSGFMVTLGFNKPDIPKHLWFYIYDEDIPASRVFSPSLQSKDNVPENCSSIQAEIFFANGESLPNANELLETTINKFIEMKLFKTEDVILKDVRFEKYANIIFTPDIYEARKIIRDYLNSIGIYTIGRFGEWDYLWTHQAYESGMKIADQISSQANN